MANVVSKIKCPSCHRFYMNRKGNVDGSYYESQFMVAVYQCPSCKNIELVERPDE